MRLFSKFNWLLLCLMVCHSCTDNEYSEEINKALQIAGENQNELKRVLSHYQDDSLKLKAAKYLIQNMLMKYTAVSEDLPAYDALFSGIATLKKENRLKRDYNQEGIFPEVDHIWDSIESQTGPLHRAHASAESDLTTISAKFLIENIDLAFAAWEFPWANHLNFDEFCQYILPYRVSDERLSS